MTKKSARRRHTAEYKNKILKLADACNARGQLAGLLRREALYSSTLLRWRAALKKEKVVEAKKRWRAPSPKGGSNVADRELAALMMPQPDGKSLFLDAEDKRLARTKIATNHATMAYSKVEKGASVTTATKEKMIESAWCRRNLMVDFVDEMGRCQARHMTAEELIVVVLRLRRECLSTVEKGASKAEDERLMDLDLQKLVSRP